MDSKNLPYDLGIDNVISVGNNISCVLEISSLKFRVLVDKERGDAR